MIRDIRDEMINLIQNVDWMDDDTRSHAIEKAKLMIPKIGYPNELLDDQKVTEMYRPLQIKLHQYFDNVQSARRWRADTEFNKLRQANKKNDWREFSEITTVNAYYQPQENAIVFPAGILQGMLFDKNQPE